MAAIHDLWSMVRRARSGFAPGGPAARPRTACEPSTEVARAPDFASAHGRAPAPGLALLRTHGEKLLQTTRALGRSPTLVVVQVHDLPELELVFGQAGADRVMEAVMAGLAHGAGGGGLAARTAADTCALLMPGGGTAAAIAMLRARFGSPCTIEIVSGRDEILAVPDVMVHALAPHDTVAQVYDELCRYIAKARKARRVRHGLPQRATRGLEVPASPAAAAPAPKPPQYSPPWPATIPVPLGGH